jgi:AMP deaminase
MPMDMMSPIDAGMQDLHLSGRSPRIFPGVVSRPQRKDSLKLMESPGSEKSGKGGAAREERPKLGRDFTRDYEEGEEPAGLEEWS